MSDLKGLGSELGGGIAIGCMALAAAWILTSFVGCAQKNNELEAQALKDGTGHYEFNPTGSGEKFHWNTRQ